VSGDVGLRCVCLDTITEVDMFEANDWEETTRDERYWMQRARDLASATLVRLGPAS
jgi:hypothetical protein